MDIAQLNELFFEAAETERKLPTAFKKQKMASWPDYVTEWSGYGYSTTETTRLKASPDQITRLDKAIDLALTKMDDEDRKLTWAVAHSAAFRDRGPKWTKIAKILGLNDPRIVKRRYKDALVRLYYKL
tara:strand:+ start:443 stop:826 length:384 start_codon:yes stop_codon:yes gene_type:complete